MTLPVSEKDLQTAVIDMAHRFGWIVAHFRPAITKSGHWVTPVAADGAGFPDLVMARAGQVVIAELKSKVGILSEAQSAWLDAFAGSELTGRRLRCFVWRPADLDNGAIERALR